MERNERENMKDMKEYEDFEKRIIEEYDEIEGIKEGVREYNRDG